MGQSSRGSRKLPGQDVTYKSEWDDVWETIKRYSPSSHQNLRHELHRRRHQGAIPVRHKGDNRIWLCNDTASTCNGRIWTSVGSWGLWHKAGRVRWIWTTNCCGCACIRLSRIYVWRGRSDSVWCIRRCWALSWRIFAGVDVAPRTCTDRLQCKLVRRQ